MYQFSSSLASSLTLYFSNRRHPTSLVAVPFFGQETSLEATRQPTRKFVRILREVSGLPEGPGLGDKVTAQGPRLLAWGPGPWQGPRGLAACFGSSGAGRAHQDKVPSPPPSETFCLGNSQSVAGEGMVGSREGRRRKPLQAQTQGASQGLSQARGSHRAPCPCPRASVLAAGTPGMHTVGLRRCLTLH